MIDQRFRPVISSEADVPAYTLPDPLIGDDGIPISNVDQWRHRRAEILGHFEQQVFGRSPAAPASLRHELVEATEDALGGIARRRQVRIHLTPRETGPQMDLLIYLPQGSSAPVPLVLGLNFYGNQTISRDPAIILPRSWVRACPEFGIEGNRATEASRGVRTSRWPVETILRRGYGLATIYYGDIVPDDPIECRRSGLQAALGSDVAGGAVQGAEAWGAISAWAWGLSRAMDYFQVADEVDASRVAVMGHSRLGKAALWAGAQDERFAMLISNNSGCGGAALFRRRFGETIERINHNFPHWFCERFKRYNDREEALPIDQHMLIALNAPRPVYVASAEEDRWADPRGEFLSAVHASSVYRLLGAEGLPVAASEMPAVNTPVMGTVGYHIRSGGHDVTDYDWAQFLNFADHHLSDS